MLAGFSLWVSRGTYLVLSMEHIWGSFLGSRSGLSPGIPLKLAQSLFWVTSVVPSSARGHWPGPQFFCRQLLAPPGSTIGQDRPRYSQAACLCPAGSNLGWQRKELWGRLSQGVRHPPLLAGFLCGNQAPFTGLCGFLRGERREWGAVPAL